MLCRLFCMSARPQILTRRLTKFVQKVYSVRIVQRSSLTRNPTHRSAQHACRAGTSRFDGLGTLYYQDGNRSSDELRRLHIR